jgi:hypothetical protein
MPVATDKQDTDLCAQSIVKTWIDECSRPDDFTPLVYLFNMGLSYNGQRAYSSLGKNAFGVHKLIRIVSDARDPMRYLFSKIPDPTISTNTNIQAMGIKTTQHWSLKVTFSSGNLDTEQRGRLPKTRTQTASRGTQFKAHLKC